MTDTEPGGGATAEIGDPVGTAGEQRPASQDQLVAGMAVIMCGAVLGLNFVLLKVALRSTGPVTVQALATVLTALFLAGYVPLRRIRLRLGRRDLAWAAAAALLIGVGGSVTTALGVQRIAAGTAALILATTPIMTIVVRVGLLHSRPQLVEMIGCAVGLGGVAIVVWGTARGDQSQLIGGLLVLLSALLWALALVVMREKLTHVPPPTVVAWMMIVSAPVLVVVAFGAERPRLHLSLAFLGSVAYLGLGGKGLSFLFQMIAVRRAGDVLASCSAFLTPVFGVLFAALILSEPIGLAKISGAAVIFLGVALITLAARHSNPPS